MAMLQFHYEPNAIQASNQLAERLEHELSQDKQVVWLVSGGSNIPLSVHIMDHLRANVADKLPNLTIALSDERYGKPGHPDSNWQQLQDAGFATGSAQVIPTLVPNLTLEDTCATYEQSLGQALSKADNDGCVIAQLGMGGDGHIAGILPDSAAASNEQGLVTGYDGGAYMRITITAMAFSHNLIKTAYCFAYGDNKHDALERLMQQELSVSDQPAQLLKLIPQAYIYTDQVYTDQQIK
jgi:6-phosphogluconolactonase/glucosamine-6-phosphate isomerase/deaminase